VASHKSSSSDANTVAMPGVEELLTSKLCENRCYLWTKSWTAVVSRVLARAVLGSV